MFDVTVYEQSFSSVAGAKSLLNSLLRSNPYFSTPLGLTSEDEAEAGPPDTSAWVSGATRATAAPSTTRLDILRGGRRLEPSPAPFERSGLCASSPMPIPLARSGSGVATPASASPGDRNIA